MAEFLDWFNVMSYDYHGTEESKTNHQAPLFANPNDGNKKYNADYTIKQYIGAGVPANKIVMGAPLYGKAWKGVKNSNNGLFQKGSGPAKGTFSDGEFDY